MNKKLSILLVALIVSSFSLTAFADHHSNKNHDRKEYYDHRGPGNHGNKKQKDIKKLEKQREKEYKKNHKHGYNPPMPAPPSHYAPPRTPRPHHSAYRPLPASYDRQFRRMVSYATRGARDISVWQISNDTFIVKYFRGGRYYTQYLYPYSGRYGSRSHISVNWSPNSLWELIPSINLNINL